jgi:Tol biopolymer transport system component
MSLRFWFRPTLCGALTVASFALFSHHAHTSAFYTTPQLAGVHDPREIHFKNVKQLTAGGQNAEAYFSSDGKKLIFQSERDGYPCDQQYTMNIDGTGVQRVSNGKGRTTCGAWTKSGKHVIYSSTYEGDAQCPPKPDYSKGYVWPVYRTFKIYKSNPDGTDIKVLFPKDLKPGEEPGYNAESVFSPDGKNIAFCSDRGGDLDIWVMNDKGKKLKQLTKRLGYEGGPWWSPDGTKIAFRAYYPETEKEKEEYLSLLKQHLIRPSTLDLYVMDADGSNVKRITSDSKENIASFAPSWTPDGKALVFSSNRSDPRRRKFEVYKINLDGTGLERLTYGEQFDGFPTFSPDGKLFVWASNRNGKVPRETNVFIAEWVP